MKDSKIDWNINKKSFTADTKGRSGMQMQPKESQ